MTKTINVKGTEYEVNDKGFVVFKHKDWYKRGDKGSWARVDDGKLIMMRAARGNLSDAFHYELKEFGEFFGVNMELGGRLYKVDLEGDRNR